MADFIGRPSGKEGAGRMHSFLQSFLWHLLLLISDFLSIAVKVVEKHCTRETPLFNLKLMVPCFVLYLFRLTHICFFDACADP